MSSLILDTHVVHWLSAEPARLSKRALAAIEAADTLSVAAMTWYELAWMAHHGRISITLPVRSWLSTLSSALTTIPVSTEIAETAVALPESFPGDPADRLIYATAVETGLQLVTKDKRLRSQRQPRRITIW